MNTGTCTWFKIISLYLALENVFALKFSLEAVSLQSRKSSLLVFKVPLTTHKHFLSASWDNVQFSTIAKYSVRILFYFFSTDNLPFAG